LQEIIDHADELAAKFENEQPAGEAVDAAPLRAVREAVQARGDVEREIQVAVLTARSAGFSWASIGGMLGTSGEAARQRYAVAPTSARPGERDDVKQRSKPGRRRRAKTG
jgi:hypothetical protein